jgi:tRNA threonylcarbamoyladenosine biosynthesis protein TsaE
MKREIHSEKEMAVVAKEFVNVLTSCTKTSLIVGLRGNLGAGKTKFSQEVAKLLGVTEPVISPTYILAKTYTTKHPQWKKMLHIDAYRFETPEEAKVLEIERQTQKGTLVLIEWPDLAEGVIQPDMYIDIDHNGGDSRTISYEKLA